MLALAIYCLVAVAAVGFAPLELEDDHERYDFQYDYDEETDNYTLTTLYDRGVDGWVSADSEGDAEFRDAFGTWMYLRIPRNHRLVVSNGLMVLALYSLLE